jgi:hypothetical protein
LNEIKQILEKKVSKNIFSAALSKKINSKELSDVI